MKIFLLEDDFALNSSIKEALEDENYMVYSFYDGETAIENISNKYSLYILDINVPNISGLEILKYIKSINNNAHVIIISANNSLEKIKKAYNYGCEDYIKKPFYIEELLLKVDKFAQKDNFICLDNGLKFDPFTKSIYLNDIELDLTKNERSLFELLITNLGQKISYSRIEEFVYKVRMGGGR